MTSKRVMQIGGITLIAVAPVLMIRTGSVALVPGAIFLWSASHLSSDQLRSLVWVVTFVLGGIGLMSATQQIAIWSSSSGWVLAGLFVSLALVCGVSSAVVSSRRA